ncbi:MAG: hypothetical protein M9962_09660 [Oligoflexia bacterium]|nr:hypothetical protein [Oligoflexia bacterium]
MKIIIWIERNIGEIFSVEKSTLKKKFSSSLNVTIEQNALLYPRFFFESLKNMDKNSSIYIFGPDIQKYKYQTFLQEHYPLIARKIRHLGSLDYFNETKILEQIEIKTVANFAKTKVN